VVTFDLVLFAVGLAFRAQIVDKVPVEATDKTVDYIATPDGVTRILDGVRPAK
jgi:5-formyltetrahydrofolate cyclo-ligase